jgi:hypothetical protein
MSPGNSKNHLGDKDEYLPTVFGLDECFGNLYHLNAEEEAERATMLLQSFGPTAADTCH